MNWACVQSHLPLNVVQYVIVPIDVNMYAVLPQKVVDQEKRARGVTVTRKAAGGKGKRRGVGYRHKLFDQAEG